MLVRSAFGFTESVPLDDVVHGLRDIGGVVADPLDVLGAEQQARAERDVGGRIVRTT